MKVTLKRITQNPVDMIYNAYRICYASSIDNITLIKHSSYNAKEDFIVPLMKDGHTSPLEHVSVTFQIEGISRACLSQLTRHRTGKYNVQSQRYVNCKHFGFVIPKLDNLNDKSKVKADSLINNHFNNSYNLYNELVELGLKKEDARSVLPINTDCNLYATFDLNNFRKFLQQRTCTHAQDEIRELAFEMLKLVQEYVPFIGLYTLRCQMGLCKECKVE